MVFDILYHFIVQITSLFYKLPKLEINDYNLNFLIFFIITLFFAKFIRKNLNPAKHPYFFALIEFPGTVIHEFSHALVAILFGNKIIKISLFPEVRRIGNQVQTKFGYVQTRGTYKGSTVLSSIAPLFLVPLIVYWLFYYIDKLNLNLPAIISLKFFILAFILPSAVLSTQDIKNFFENLLSIYGIIIFTVFISLIYYFFSLIYTSFNNFIQNNLEVFILFIVFTLIMKLSLFFIKN